MVAKIFYFQISAIFLFTVMSNNSVYSEETDARKQAKQWFEWGEYNQIIDSVPNYLLDSTICRDTVVTAMFHIYLGVAFYALGKTGKARSEFLAALEVNPSATINHNYVSTEIMNLFLSTLEDFKLRKREKLELELLMQKTEEEKIKRQSLIDSLDNRVQTGKKRGLLIAAITASATTIGFAGTSVYEYYAGEKKYRQFCDAAQRGDLQEYNKYKNEVEKYNIRTVLTASASGVCALASTLFYIVVFKQRSKLKRITVKNPRLDYVNNTIQVTVSF